MADYSTESEADTRAQRIDPALAAAGWGGADSPVRREVIALGRITQGGKRVNPMSADYVLHHMGQKLAVIEAKRAGKPAAEGVGQAKEYARRLKTRFAYASNGLEWYEIDMQGGERSIPAPPSPADLWARAFPAPNAWRDRFGAIPFGAWGNKPPRYYQRNAITAVLDAISNQQRRILLTLATGTGKTNIARELMLKLFHAKWNLGGNPTRRPRILFLADRNFLAQQAKNEINDSFGEGVCLRVNVDELAKRKGAVPTNASIFFTIFQTLTTGGDGAEAFRQYPPDFFDFIIIDECHRGGANAEGSWRAILDYFEPAYQLGLTATPKRDDNADTYTYFGEPVYKYSLREGIEDGYLTPFRVRQFSSNIDTYTFDGADKVLVGAPDDETTYEERHFNRTIEIRERELHRVRTFLAEINHNEKTIVFCATQAHAALIRDLINQEVKHPDPDYCVRVTANDGAIGEAHLERFQQNSKTVPTILTTSQKLSTGVDAKNVRNIVLMRPINSMIEFKQIIGRGTRVYDGKDYFTIYDFVKAYLKFDDPEWDGEPILVNGDPPKGKTPKGEGGEIGGDEPTLGSDDPTGGEGTGGGDTGGDTQPQMIQIELGRKHIVNIAATTFWGPDGKPISAKDFIERMFGALPTLFKDEDDLRKLWGNPDTRKALLAQLAGLGYDAAVLKEVRKAIMAEKSDIFDVLAYIAFSTDPITREERAEAGRAAIAGQYDAKLTAFLNFVLGQYVETGAEDLDRAKLPEFLRLKFGSQSEGANALGGVKQVAQTFVDFQKHLYS